MAKRVIEHTFVERETYTDTGIEWEDVSHTWEDIPEQIPAPIPPPPFLKRDMAQVPVLYAEESCAGPDCWRRSMNIDSCFKDGYVNGVCPPASAKEMRNNATVGIEQTARGTRLYTNGTPGKTIGARLVLESPTGYDFLKPQAFKTIQGRFVYELTKPFNLDKGGNWVSLFQVKTVDINGQASWNMDIEYAYYESPEVYRFNWIARAAQGINVKKVNKVPIVPGIITMDFTMKLHPTTGYFIASINDVVAVELEGRTSNDQGYPSAIYPALLYGDKFKAGVTNEWILKSTELAVSA